ncbi:asparagine synthetase B family protein [Candidatus Marimicrobium litorale]|nr:asparagine synthase C-terminal domain-containing protein [Candidatus Marimicrobium litorale]
MTQTGSNAGAQVAEGLVHHKVLGYFAASASHSLSISAKTLLPASGTDGARYELGVSGTLAKLPCGGAVAINGQARFDDENLATIAKSQTMAAALAAGYQEYGEKIFIHLRGAFCCVIVDIKQERVLIGLDRLGQHSIYYAKNNEGLSFGTSADDVLSAIRGEKKLLHQGIYNYLYFHMVPCSETIYDGLKKLPAAHYIVYQGGQCRVENYWQPRFFESNNLSSTSLSAELKCTLRQAVKNCMPTSGTIGCFLSGGLDSTTVTGMLAEVSEGEAEAYSIGFSAEGYDEMAYARISAKHFGVKLNEYYVTPQDVVDALPLIATSYEEPFGNSSALPAYFCARMAVQNGVDTLLAGDGGDEIFAGNERYIKQQVFAHYEKVPEPLRRGLLEPLLKFSPGGLPLVSKARSYIEQANMPLPDRLQSYNFLHRHPVSEIFSDDLLSEVDIESPIELLRSIYHRPADASDLNRMLYLDWQITLADNDLRKVSHTCALAGVNVTYPMLDDSLVALSCRVPSKVKMKGGDLRHFFKSALQDWLPEETISKNKQGFGLPFGIWMQTYKPLRELAYDNLLKLKARRYIRPEFIDKTIKMHQSDHAAYYGELVWILTVFELWMEKRSGNHIHTAGESAKAQLPL